MKIVIDFTDIWHKYVDIVNRIGFENIGIFFLMLVLPYVFISRYIFDEDIPLEGYIIIFGSIYLIIVGLVN